MPYSMLPQTNSFSLLTTYLFSLFLILFNVFASLNPTHLPALIFFFSSSSPSSSSGVWVFWAFLSSSLPHTVCVCVSVCLREGGGLDWAVSQKGSLRHQLMHAPAKAGWIPLGVPGSRPSPALRVVCSLALPGLVPALAPPPL